MLDISRIEGKLRLDGPGPCEDGYAVCIDGDCMAPAVRDGDYVAVNPGRRPREGELAVIWLKGNPKGALKRIVTLPPPSHPEDEIVMLGVFEQDNPSRQFSLPNSRIEALHSVVRVVRREDASIEYDGVPETIDGLSFVRLSRDRKQDDFWTVESTGAFGNDAELGGRAGIAFLEFLSRYPEDRCIVEIAAAQSAACAKGSAVGWQAVCSFWKPILGAALDAFRRDPERYRCMVSAAAARARAVDEKIAAGSDAKGRRKAKARGRIRAAIVAALVVSGAASSAGAQDAERCKGAAVAYAQSRQDVIFENANIMAETESVPRRQLHETRLNSALIAQLGDLMAIQALHCPVPAEPMGTHPDLKREVECATALMHQQTQAMLGAPSVSAGALAECKP